MLDSGDFGATTFSVDLMAKDLQLAVDAAGSDLAVTQACLDVARAAAAAHPDEDYSAMTAQAEDA
jgi:3-hydroxyisobutyrate dehydrogenase-like beta-hydroxyacid dehydrogenase